MTGLHALIRRNCKLFFKDKGMFITSLITPAVLLVLYTTFLAGVYRDAFTSSLPSNLTLDSKLLGGLVGGHAGLLAAGGQLCHGGVLLQYADGAGQGHRRAARSCS